MDQAIQIVEGEDRYTRLKVGTFVLGGAGTRGDE